jgi:hypothetical protein
MLKKIILLISISFCCYTAVLPQQDITSLSSINKEEIDFIEKHDDSICEFFIKNFNSERFVVKLPKGRKNILKSSKTKLIYSSSHEGINYYLKVEPVESVNFNTELTTDKTSKDEIEQEIDGFYYVYKELQNLSSKGDTSNFHAEKIVVDEEVYTINSDDSATIKISYVISNHNLYTMVSVAPKKSLNVNIHDELISSISVL